MSPASLRSDALDAFAAVVCIALANIAGNLFSGGSTTGLSQNHQHGVARWHKAKTFRDQGSARP